MEILLTEKESLDYFYNALCNAVGTGYISNYDISLKYNTEDYQEAKNILLSNDDSACYEDILIQILKNGKTLIFHDYGKSIDDATITIQDVYDRVKLTPINHLTDMIKENDDVITASVLLQTVFYKEIIFA